MAGLLAHRWGQLLLARRDATGWQAARTAHLYQPSLLSAHDNRGHSLFFWCPLLLVPTRCLALYKQQVQPIAKYSDGTDTGDTAWRRAKPSGLDWSLPAVPRWRRSPWAVDPLYPKGPYDATKWSTSRSRPFSSEAM